MCSKRHYLWQQVLNKIFSSYKCQCELQLFLQCNLITQHIIATHLSYYRREATFHQINGTLRSGLAGEGCLSALYLIRLWLSFKLNVMLWPAGNNLTLNYTSHDTCISIEQHARWGADDSAGRKVNNTTDLSHSCSIRLSSTSLAYFIFSPLFEKTRFISISLSFIIFF